MKQVNDELHMKNMCVLKEVHSILNSSDGKKLLDYLVNLYFMECGDYNSDPYKLYYAEGQKSVVASLMKLGDINIVNYINAVSKHRSEIFDNSLVNNF